MSSSRPQRFQILNQRCSGLVHPFGHIGMIFGDVFVAVPIAAGKPIVRAAPDLHKTHAPLQQPARDEAAVSKVLRRWVVEAIEFLRRLRLFGDVQHLRCAYLETRGHLVGADARFQPGIAFARGQMMPGSALEVL